MARWITAEEPAIAPAPLAVTQIRPTITAAELQSGGDGSRPGSLIGKATGKVPAPAKKRRATSTKKPASPATSAFTGLPVVVPVPGAEEMYAAYCARGKAARRGKKSAMKYQYPDGFVSESGALAWKPGAPNYYGPTPILGPPSPQSYRTAPPLSGSVSTPTGPDARDVAWRKKNATLDGYLAHLEVAGRILRRYAIDADTMHLELPESPGSLTVGETLEWSAERITANLEHLANTRQEVAA